MEKNPYEIINQTIQNILPGSKVWLFGSRAKGTSTSDSDFDLLIITSNNLSINEKFTIKAKLRKLFAIERIDTDLILESQSEVEEKRKQIGHVVYYALKEAIPL